jgi:hypothetical protein
MTRKNVVLRKFPVTNPAGETIQLTHFRHDKAFVIDGLETWVEESQSFRNSRMEIQNVRDGGYEDPITGVLYAETSR